MSGPSAAPPVAAERKRVNPRRSRRARNSTVSATNLILSHIEQELPWRGLIPLMTMHTRGLEIIDERETHIFGSTDNGTTLWRAYRTIGARWPNFQIARIAKPNGIYPVFRKLFAKQPAQGK